MNEKNDLIGESNKPIRAIAFVGGGWTTALQLGVTHALLVSRGKAPDVVVGISAGAVNAVALAEIMQAGKEVPQDRRLERRVARFRDFFDLYCSSPGSMLSAFLPDSLQIDTQRPLEPLKLPIHATKERDYRDTFMHSRSGLMNVYNQMLRLRIPASTITRVIRRILGIIAAGEIRNPRRRCIAVTSERLRLLDLMGNSLHRLAFLVPLSFLAAIKRVSKPFEGRSAGELISRKLVLLKFGRILLYLISLVVLVVLWLIATPFFCAYSILSLSFCGVRIAIANVRKCWSDPAKIDFWDRFRLTLVKAGRVTISGAKMVLSLLSDFIRWSAFLACGILFFNMLFRFSIFKKFLNSVFLWQDPVAIFNNLGHNLVVPLVALSVLSLSTFLFVWFRRKNMPINFLRRNSIANGLLDIHPVRQLFVRMFDPNYYGKIIMDKVVESALKDQTAADREVETSKTLKHYSQADPTIRVGVAAANVATGSLETMSEGEKVVDSLLAACAVVPLFPPQKIGGQLYVDGTNVANETTWPLLHLLRKKIPRDPDNPASGDLNLKASALFMYPVSPLPLSKKAMEFHPDEERKFISGNHIPLIDVAIRAFKLQQFRDAMLEHDLTEFHTRIMPEDGNILCPEKPEFRNGRCVNYLRTWVFPIEPTKTISINFKLLSVKSEGERRRIIAETVADGCRAAMERMARGSIGNSIQRFPKTKCEPADGRYISCKQVMANRLGIENAEFPGSHPDYGPGLFEVCKHCRIDRDMEKDEGNTSKKNSASLSYSKEERNHPDWPLDPEFSKRFPASPLEGETEKRGPILPLGAFRKKNGERRQSLGESQALFPRVQWPIQSRVSGNAEESDAGENNENGRRTPCKRPTVSFLFSGGVFRGVYQVGVLNALSMVGLRPDLVAGASIGSITAAMAASLFYEHGSGGATGHVQRAKRLRRLAGSYMAVDRLVLTDRFADFVRTLTVRASQAKISLRQIDRFVRQYDQAQAGVFGKEARIVMAGLERLFYLSPFELMSLLKALKLRKQKNVLEQLRDYFQEFLDRGGVGDEILGAEPLSLLIAEHVLPKDIGSMSVDPDAIGFDHFLDQGIMFLATATNLTEGRLEYLGEEQSAAGNGSVSLRQGLLASSAFPGVFRPRWNWEVKPDVSNADLLIDGGVMDNLPLDAVARFLNNAAQNNLIVPNPETVRGPVPHLLFSASLQTDCGKLDKAAARELENNWYSLLGRTRRLGYNKKLEMYEEAQRAIRKIKRIEPEKKRTDESLIPLDMEVLTIRPQWLCGTFAFHPMLGFRRRKQARSIAHGCASTIEKISQFASDSDQKFWLEGWGVDTKNLPEPKERQCKSRFRPIKQPVDGKTGGCWYCPQATCTFSCEAMDEQKLPDSVADAVRMIYEECGRSETHCSGE